MLGRITKIEKEIKLLKSLIACCDSSQKETILEETTLSPIIAGNLIFKWGEATFGENPSNYTETVSIVGENSTPYSVKKYKLLLEVPFWQDIKDYSPVLLIDRYKPKKKKGNKKINKVIVGTSYRKAGYKHETKESTLLNNRINEIALTNSKNILDFKQENHFVMIENKPKTSGISNSLNNKFWDSIKKIGPSIYLGFRLRLNNNQKIFETGHLGFLRMYIIDDTITYKIQ